MKHLFFPHLNRLRILKDKLQRKMSEPLRGKSFQESSWSRSGTQVEIKTCEVSGLGMNCEKVRVNFTEQDEKKGNARGVERVDGTSHQPKVGSGKRRIERSSSLILHLSSTSSRKKSPEEKSIQ